MVFELTYKNLENKSHDDILLKLGSYEQICDSYYFELDNAIPKGSPAKSKTIIKRLLEQWLEAIDSFGTDKPIFLPYDFSDQYTGCLCIKKSLNQIEILPGFTNIEGWSFYPSDIETFLVGVTDFKPAKDAETIRMPLEQLKTEILASIEALNSE